MAEKSIITKDTPQAEIEADIAETRRDISGTVGEIRDRMAPDRLKEQAKDTLRRSTIGRVKHTASRIGTRARGTGSDLLGSVKRDPVPIAMVGIGIAWLLYNRTSHRESDAVTGTIAEKSENLTGSMQEKTEALSGRTREKTAELSERAKGAASRVGTGAQEQYQTARSWFEEAIDRNPLAVAVAAFGIGSVLGLAIPESRKEQAMMGSASKSVLSKAKETAQETMEKAQRAAGKAVETAKQELKAS